MRVRARARLEVGDVDSHREMDAFLHELLRDLGTMASDPSCCALVDEISKNKVFVGKVDGTGVEGDAGVSCRK